MINHSVSQQHAREPSHPLVRHAIINRSCVKFHLTNVAVTKHCYRFLAMPEVRSSLAVIHEVKLLKHRVIPRCRRLERVNLCRIS